MTMQQTDNELIERLTGNLISLNKTLQIMAENDIKIELKPYDVTGINHRIRCFNYTFNADKRLCGGLD